MLFAPSRCAPVRRRRHGAGAGGAPEADRPSEAATRGAPRPASWRVLVTQDRFRHDQASRSTGVLMPRSAGIASRLVIAALGATLLSGTAVLAQGTQSPAPAAPTPAAPTPAPPDPVVAKVDGQPIHLSDLKDAAQALPENLRGVPQQTLLPMLLDQAIDSRALIAEAHKSGLDKDPGVQRQIAAAADRALQTAMLSKEVGPTVTDDAVHARYDQQYRRQARRGGGARQAHPGRQRGRREEDHRRAEGRRRLRRAGQAVQQGPGRRPAGRRSRLLQEGRDGAGIRRRRVRAEAGPGHAGRRCTPSSAGT